MSERSDYEKAELILGINSFNKPAEKSGPEAWGALVSNLLFMKKGTYPTDPDMGCEIQKYEFSFIDDVVDEIEELISDQIRRYLPDIPFDTVTISKETSDTGKPILLILLSFTYNENTTDTVVVAAEKTNSNINFEVVI